MKTQAMKTPTLQTERLILRPVRIEDAPAIQKHFNHWEIIKHLSTTVPWPYPEDGALTHIRDTVLPEVKKGNWHVWAIARIESPGEAIGLINFRKKSDDNRGFWIAREYQGRGLMSEAISAIDDFSLEAMDIDKIIVKNAKSNLASRRVKEKTGAILLREQPANHRSGEAIEEVWEITRHSWKEAKTQRGSPL